ncbi:MAG: bifunctional [glutamate--ammonia ligase]-adenylyl-L-tyrosine phosphorylase/[glutamate--ammonia-ligase] adenylyltransferase [bacterium]|nr:bifunctional [glutamate--ammonia ligase]-adenylyl-L-tyrosine phosphorylase/[glutamate--ammonia-ligase] adenylyltransferase [bacterium]
MLSLFEEVGFKDDDAAVAALEPLLEEGRPHLATHLAHALSEAADPDTCLVRLVRFLESCLSAHSHLDLMNAAPTYTRMLLTILGQSHYLTDILCRNPEYMSWLWDEASLDEARPRDELADEIVTQVCAFDRFEAQCQTMRRFKRREILRIATRDIFRRMSLASVTEDLSNLADASLEAAIEGSQSDLLRRFGAPKAPSGDTAGFAVLAMGKLGGRELNFSSDIDLIFLFSDEGTTEGGSSGSVTNGEYFHKLGERVIKAMSELTSEGYVFRVDMRLRPYGRVGPLAVSLDNALEYYETVGQAWERQALIKTRPAAGDLDLGQAFIDKARPFVYPRYFDDETLEDIRQIKQQTEAQIAEQGQTGTEVKLGRGGIRDIEFAIQMLQLLNGGRFEDLRTPSTLQAIPALARRSLLTAFEADTLASNYVFLRQVEHRLQIEGSQQRHALPADASALELFARQLGYPSRKAFMREYTDRTEANRTILERFLATEGAGHRWIIELLHSQTGAKDGLERLSSMGFADPGRAREELMHLYAGSSERPHSAHIRQQCVGIIPILLEALVETANPDQALMRVGQLLANLRAPGAIYDILGSSPHLSEYLVRLVVNSEYLTDILMRDPGLFDTIGVQTALDEPSSRADLETQLAALSDAYDPSAAPYRLHTGETLRVGMRELFRDLDVFQVGQELSVLAEVCLAYVLWLTREAVARRHGACSGRFAVLALGKLGGCEMGYGSDLDLVFVYEASAEPESGMAASEYFAAVASGVIRSLKERTKYGVLYDIDARLRPDGKKGMLAVSDARLESYYQEEAQPWERLALAKVRAVGGDLEFAESVAERARDLAFSLPLTPENLANVEDVRTRIVAKASPLDLKKHEGGIAEIEFAIRLLQMRHAANHEGLKRADVAGAVGLLTEIEALSAKEGQDLLDTYTLFRRMENRIRMQNGRAGSALPDTPEDQADLAARLGIDEDLAELVEKRKAGVHAIYMRILGSLS